MGYNKQLKAQMVAADQLDVDAPIKPVADEEGGQGNSERLGA